MNVLSELRPLSLIFSSRATGTEEQQSNMSQTNIANNNEPKSLNFVEFMAAKDVQSVTNVVYYTVGYATACFDIDERLARIPKSTDEANAILMALVDTVIRAATDNTTDLDEQLKSHSLRKIADRIYNGLSVTGDQKVMFAKTNMRFVMKHDGIGVVNDPIDVIDNLIERAGKGQTQDVKINTTLRRRREEIPTTARSSEGLMQIVQELQKDEARMSTGYPCNEDQVRCIMEQVARSDKRELLIYSLGKFAATLSATAAVETAHELGLNMEKTNELIWAAANFAPEATAYKKVVWEDVLADAAFHADLYISPKQKAPARVYNNKNRGTYKSKKKRKKIKAASSRDDWDKVLIFNDRGGLPAHAEADAIMLDTVPDRSKLNEMVDVALNKML
ncbi:hypothetical protein PCE1_003737 [Barthelona sp. PCE]